MLPQMFKPVRVLATIVFLASIVLVFVSAYVINSDVSVLFFSKNTSPDERELGSMHR